MMKPEWKHLLIIATVVVCLGAADRAAADVYWPADAYWATDYGVLTHHPDYNAAWHQSLRHFPPLYRLHNGWWWNSHMHPFDLYDLVMKSQEGSEGVPEIPLELIDPMSQRHGSQDSVLLMVQVPADARVFVNGQETTSTGNLRRYITRNLKPNQRYIYEVRAEITRDGKTIRNTKIVKLSTGKPAGVAFSFTGDEVKRLAAQTQSIN